MHTTHATQLFLDVTRHVSRTRVNTFHVAPARDAFVYIFIASRKSETAPLTASHRRNVPSVYRYINNNHRHFSFYLIYFFE